MDDILLSITGIVVAAILMFIFPLMVMADRTDDVSQLTVEIATTEFVDNIRTSGKITPEEYGTFLNNLGSTGNTYNVEMEVKVLDENPQRKSIQQNSEEENNVYYSIYNSQIEATLSNNNTYYLKEGDIVTVSAKNTNQTIAATIKKFLLYSCRKKCIHNIIITWRYCSSNRKIKLNI